MAESFGDFFDDAGNPPVRVTGLAAWLCVDWVTLFFRHTRKSATE